MTLCDDKYTWRIVYQTNQKCITFQSRSLFIIVEFKKIYENKHNELQINTSQKIRKINNQLLLRLVLKTESSILIYILIYIDL